MAATHELDQLYGMVIGLQNAVRALIVSHPNALAAAQAVDREMQAFETSGLYSSLSEDTLEAMRQTRAWLLGAPSRGS